MRRGSSTSDRITHRIDIGSPADVDAFVEKWLRQQVVEDLYAYGNHTEVRLCAAMALRARLSECGLWDAAVEATYRNCIDIHRAPRFAKAVRSAALLV